MGPAREGLHARFVDRIGAVHDRERVAEQGPVGEDVDLGEGEVRRVAHGAVSSAAARARMPRSIASGGTVTNERRKVFFIAAPAKKGAPGTKLSLIHISEP